MSEIPTVHESRTLTIEEDQQISLLDLAIIVAKHKKLILGLPTLTLFISALIALLLPNIYTATTKILPPQQSQSNAAALMAQLGGVAAAAGGTLGLKNPADLYVGMLKSRTVADALIKQFDLNSVFDTKYQSQARKKLESNTSIASAKDGIITLEFEDEDPKRAMDVANGYVEELYKITKSLAITEAAQRRLFFEKQLELARENLSKSEESARDAMNRGGLIKVDEQGRSTVEITARLRAQIAVKEVQINAMHSYAADMNPQLIAARQELVALRDQLARIEGVSEKGAPQPEQSIHAVKNLGLLRDVKYNETVFELMAKQFELAKVDEAKDPSLVQVIDKAILPDRKSKPKRVLIVLVSTVISLFIAFIWAFVAESLKKYDQTPDEAKKMLLLRNFLSWRTANNS